MARVSLKALVSSALLAHAVRAESPSEPSPSPSGGSSPGESTNGPPTEANGAPGSLGFEYRELLREEPVWSMLGSSQLSDTAIGVDADTQARCHQPLFKSSCIAFVVMAASLR